MRDVTRRQALGFAASALAAFAQAGCAATQPQEGGEGAEKVRSVQSVEALDASVTAGWNSAYYTPAYGSLDEAVLASHEVARTIEAEGVVLLANNGVLPLTEGCAVSLLGRSAEDPLFGGYGAGSVAADAVCTGFYDGLVEGGLEVNPTVHEWLSAHAQDRPRGGIQTLDVRATTTYYIGELPWSSYPEDVRASVSETVAVVVLGRASGEGYDLSLDLNAALADERFSSFVPNEETANYAEGQHSLQLTAEELSLIAGARETADHVVVLLNTGTTLEVGPLVEEGSPYQVDALLHVGFPGAVGAEVVGELLCGRRNPCGRTCDLWARDMRLSPSFNTMGEHLYTDIHDFYPGNETTGDGARFVEYLEGIYVGYRYFETAAAMGAIDYDGAVTFPFGYGLSYTSFSWSLLDCRLDGEDVMLSARVTNSGKLSGKDVVEAYVSAPWDGSVEKSAVALVAFAKTSELAPGESQTLELSWPVRQMASWSAADGCWALAAGSYQVSLRTDSHHVVEARTLDLDEKRYQTDDATGADVFARFSDLDEYFDDQAPAAGGGAPVLLTRNDMAGSFPVPARDKTAASVGVTLSMYDAEAEDDGATTVPEIGAENGVSLIDLRGRDFDDPLWDMLLDQLSPGDMVALVCTNAGEKIDSVGKPATDWDDSPVAMGGMERGGSHCVWPSEYLVAETWDVDLLRSMGEAVGEESLSSGIFGWWSPAINMHRSPFSGRNYEYYSEDPLLTGSLARAMLDGGASRGMVNILKHFCVYDQETGRREHLCTWATEQAVREIYARPFEMVVKSPMRNAVPVLDVSTGEQTQAEVNVPLSIMSCYSFLGNTWGGGREDLQTGLLRDEWGFDGVVLSDFSVDDYYMDHDQGIAAGTDLMLATAATGTVADPRSAHTLNNLRRSVHRYLYVVVNSNAMNGISPTVRVTYS
ncbi:MAG: glycoside hydrolase family 3 C-terminal domain-containing protein [Olsenella sp.]|nr:glycoside hydrolase family 3 C-terminal domain-containing protein [Olsenella sp.]